MSEPTRWKPLTRRWVERFNNSRMDIYQLVEGMAVEIEQQVRADLEDDIQERIDDALREEDGRRD